MIEEPFYILWAFISQLVRLTRVTKREAVNPRFVHSPLHRPSTSSTSSKP